MPEAPAIRQFERRLAELGCPSARLRAAVAELEDHHEDLVNAAREEGLTEAEATARAAELLGEPVALAEHVAAVLRQSSWWGRHPFIGFCLLPPVAIFLTLLPGVMLEFFVFERYFTPDVWAITAGGGPGFPFIVNAANGSAYLFMALVALVFCRLARRSAAGTKWALGACAVCSLHGYFNQLLVVPHSIRFGFRFTRDWAPDDWILPAVPLVIGAVVWLRQRILMRRYAGVEAGAAAMPVEAFQPGRTPLVTPTRLTVAIFVVALVGLLVVVRSALAREEARGMELKAKMWPVERLAVLQQLKAGQVSTVSAGAATISLTPWINAGLDESVGPEDAPDNALPGLPRGTHVFAGVPFEVEGRVQLMGRKLLETRTEFPAKVKGIVVVRRATRIHLLHGVSSLDEKLFGTAVAKLVLNYADGSQAELPIVAGQHVLDWWGAIYKTDVPEKLRQPSARGSSLAWAGANPYLKQRRPEASLRLFRTTFENPQPEREIARIDYVSTVTEAAPFLIGLTLE